ncbi:hypothetical protein Kpol_448p7 [Vanderwaltozyma polyspora DSM 70294]|uniref:Uncharacterized protein n=1 Tax=Vanderwaltozyma polyspora (strain ATCC 22028 / DSM 70294 / BCRC 21397 / CBS 2163 / NBRC 10782 / NRRL Y-8283 / UCD 57-17) TaxID=436907 RepID=A7TQY3_VANPO|nr:uncharacterized protein Kpol_448p7 [Vanderwaltozyma polyspora DSM 70294]EDO15320.1 hypothetical protein Kpol_448p7 [Vanderwaltozyma polyspora DSM 70294]
MKPSSPAPATDSTAIKIIFNKDTFETFAQNSPTLNHLTKYKIISNLINYLLSISILTKILSIYMSLNLKLKNNLIDSPNSPFFIKISYKYLENFIWKIDELFNLLILRDGIDSLINQYNKPHEKNIIPGSWLVFFTIDYMANITNTLLQEFIVKPFKMPSLPNSNKKSDEIQDSEEINNKNLPHVNELSITTKTISTDLKDMAFKNYEKIVKPATDKIQSSTYVNTAKEKINNIVKPTVDTAKSTYKTVSTQYEDNLNKSESVPRALVSTSVDLGNLTLEKLKLTKSNENENTISQDEDSSLQKNESITAASDTTTTN